MSSDYSIVESLNVLDEQLLPCSREPLTGFSEMVTATRVRPTMEAIQFVQ